jgi:prephenate dehydrogenase
MQTVAIFGVGLIGGSFGLAIKRAGFTGVVLGVSSERTIAEALKAGAVDRGASMDEACRAADLIYLAQPIGRILELLPCLDPLVRGGALITDAGSTKSAIAECAAKSIRRAQFLGGHPMAGKERRGAAAADADLFRNRTYVLTPASKEAMTSVVVSDFVGWLEKIGANIIVMDAAAHDRLVAFTSHLPQLASTALAETVDGRGDTRVAGSGLLDTTRLALSAYDIWKDIIATNRENIAAALDSYIEQLAAIRMRLNSPLLEEDFEKACRFRSGLNI